MTTSTEKNFSRHPAWIVLLVGVPLFMGFFRGPLFIDDAYITFRYAANLAAGGGFVFNSEPLLGTTTPLYCLLLAGGTRLGVSLLKTAFFIGVVAGAFTPLLLWRTGIATSRPLAGLVSALLLALFPHWWLNMKTGMETTLAGFLILLALYLDFRNQPLASGLACGLLVLTRPDTAALPLLLFLLHVVRDRKGAMRFGVAGVLALLPWIIYGFFAFGSPLPQSLAAKRLIHFYPWHLALTDYLSWFAAVREPPGMFLLLALWLVAAVGICRSGRERVVLVLWPLLFILGLSFLEVGPFFWYKIPVAPVFFLVAAEGLEQIVQSERTPAWLRKGVFVLPAIFILGQLLHAGPQIMSREKLLAFTAKERILAEMAQVIQRRTQEQKRTPAQTKVFAGEVGVIGYELLDYVIIDSAGINSREVYELRKRDWQSLKQAHPQYSWKEQWWGSPAWSQEVIEKFQPEFIASNLLYLHLPTLLRDPAFLERYSQVQLWTDPGGNKYLLLERKP